MPKIVTTIRKANSADQKVWDALAGHPLQSWQWGEFRKAMGVDLERLIVEKNGKPSDCWQITFHTIPHTSRTVGYFPKGPKPDAFMLRELQNIGREKKALSIQLEPRVEQDHTFDAKKLGLLPSPHPLFTKYTFVLDLTLSEEELLKAMHSKTRYNIKLAQKHGVHIEEDNSDRAFQEYLRLTAETTGRQGFYAHNTKYHETMWRIMKTAGIARLFTATYQGETLAAWVLFGWGKTLYYPYGSSSRNHREVMAPTLLLWEIMRWAKREGYTAFDLWGALSPNADTNDPWYGFHRFKQGFSPKLVEYVGSFDVVIAPLFYRLYNGANALRWAMLRLRSRL